MSEENKEVAVAGQNKAVVISDTFVPKNLTELKELAAFLSDSDLIPKSLGGRKENVAIVLMLGHEIGIAGVAALQNIFVVNNRPSIYGDLATALIRRSGLAEELAYKFEGTGPSLKCIATGKRKGDKQGHTVEFSWEDAKLAGSAGKDTYLKNPKDMIMWKALHRLYKFLWPDVLKGMNIREIVADEVTDVESEVVTVEIPAVTAPTVPPPVATEPPARKGRGPNKPKVEAPAPAEAPVEAPAEAPVSAAAEALAEIPMETPAEAAEPKEEAPEAPAEQVERIVGTLLGAIKLNDPKTAATLGFAAKMQTKDGEVRYLFESYEAATAAQAHKGRTVTAYIAKMDKPMEGIRGLITKLEPIA